MVDSRGWAVLTVPGARSTRERGEERGHRLDRPAGALADHARRRVRTGGGEGAYELAHEIIKEPYTLEFS
jgi:hypothetical protein